MARANDEHTNSTEATSDTHAKEREPGRLTPMPDCLMHWWTPLLLAGILLAAGSFLASIWRMPLRPVSWWTINPYCPPSWPFNYHWPSKDAMALCVTIAGAGFAFSAWQQRNHDNTTRELERITDAQREEFWQMRNTAHTLLSTNSYYEQYEGACRYFELADLLNESSQKQSNTTRILNSAILSALCTHLRYLGDPLANNFENENERGELQNLILNNILERINSNLKGYWGGIPVNLTDITFLTSVSIPNFTSNSRIHLNGSRFERGAIIEIAETATLYWEHCSFLSYLEVTGKTSDPEYRNPILHHDNFPNKIISCKFENISVCTLEALEHHITHNHLRSFPQYPSFKNCNFLRPKATQQHPDKATTDGDTDILDDSATPDPPNNYIWAAISFNFNPSDIENHTKLYFSNCIFSRLTISNKQHIPNVAFTGCSITQDNETSSKNIAPKHFKFTDCKFFGPTDQ